MSLAESCRNFRLDGARLVCECLLANGEYRTSWIDLDQYIGIVDGKLVWHAKGFSKSCTDLRLEDTILYAKYEKTGSECFIDLALKLRNDNGVLL